MAKKNKLIIGRCDFIDLPELGIQNIAAKIDTGAYTSAIHCSRIKLQKENEVEYLFFKIPGSHQKKLFRVKNFKLRNIKSSSGHSETRFVIKTKVTIFGREINTEFSLANRSEMKFPVLLGRKLLKDKFIVDVSQINLSRKEQLKQTSDQ